MSSLMKYNHSLTESYDIFKELVEKRFSKYEPHADDECFIVSTYSVAHKVTEEGQYWSVIGYTDESLNSKICLTLEVKVERGHVKFGSVHVALPAVDFYLETYPLYLDIIKRCLGSFDSPAIMSTFKEMLARLNRSLNQIKDAEVIGGTVIECMDDLPYTRHRG